MTRCLGHEPTTHELESLSSALADFRSRYAASPEDADKLLMPGDARPPSALSKPELAAWTMIANSVLNLYQTTTQN